MKIVINTGYGGVTEETKANRLNPQFIKDVESGRFVGMAVEGPFGGYEEALKVIEIPDEITDYKIINYDGAEGIFYVLNGNLYFKGSEESYRIFQ